MVLDTSVEERDEKADRDAIIVGVPEYAADIYAYLREAEVCPRQKNNYMQFTIFHSQQSWFSSPETV